MCHCLTLTVPVCNFTQLLSTVLTTVAAAGQVVHGSVRTLGGGTDVDAVTSLIRAYRGLSHERYMERYCCVAYVQVGWLVCGWGWGVFRYIIGVCIVHECMKLLSLIWGFG